MTTPPQLKSPGRKPGECGSRASYAARLKLAACIACIASAAMADSHLEVYSKQIRPLFSERCFSCHGGLKQEAGLRLDTVALMIEGGESGSVIAKGDPAKSLILERVSDTDPATRMPPEGEAEPLSAEQLAEAGEPSQLDLFDPKPTLVARHGEDLPESVRGGQRLTGMTSRQARFPLVSSPYRFARHGPGGAWFSELLPHTAGVPEYRP